MRKIIVLISLLAICFLSSAQNCEDREANLLNAMGGLSAGFMYNTFISIGSMSDGYMKDAYTKENTISLIDEQIQLIESIQKVMNDLLVKKSLISNDDQLFVKETTELMKGLQQQARFFKDYVNSKESTKAASYEKQRQDNWKKISKLMGLDDKNSN